MVFGSCFFRWEVWGCLKIPFNWNTTWITLGIGSVVLWSVGKFWGEVSASKNQGGWGRQRGRDNMVNVNGFYKPGHLNLKTKRGWDVIRSLQQLLPKIYCAYENYPPTAVCSRDPTDCLITLHCIHQNTSCVVGHLVKLKGLWLNWLMTTYTVLYHGIK